MRNTNVNPLRAEMLALANNVISQFNARTKVEGANSGINFGDARMEASINDNSLWLMMTAGETVHNITIPVPFTRKGIMLITSNDVERAVCDHFFVQSDTRLSYVAAVYRILLGDFSQFIETVTCKKTMFVQQLAYSVINKNTAVVVYNIQKAINELVNKMPLHETDMNSWMMNNRLILVDPEFEILTDPTDKLNYQVKKNVIYHERGWTSIGLSDGTLADKNLILTNDLRPLTPFGIKHHNPHRNLFSTMGMKGDELPIIRTKSSQSLMDAGITRKGWNLFTAYIDVPGTFEDQILVDIRHRNKAITSERRVQCFGEALVKAGQVLKLGMPIGKADDGEITRFDIHADSAKVIAVNKTTVAIGGLKKTAFNVIVAITRKLKDATKFTNMHGNKGVIRLMELGHAVNPTTGEETPIDVLVSAKTIKKRQNFGQLLELMANNINDSENPAKVLPSTCTKTMWSSNEIGVVTSCFGKRLTPKPVVLQDDFEVTPDALEAMTAKHVALGFSEQATLECHLSPRVISHYKFAEDERMPFAVCGKVFWGVCKEAEDQLWEEGATTAVNGKGLRVAGLKFSPVEFGALETWFGVNNPVTNEILSYVQGIDNLKEHLTVLGSSKGVLPVGAPVVDPLKLKRVDQTQGTLFTKEALLGTVADEFFYPKGFVLKLPVTYQVAVGHEPEYTYRGAAVLTEDIMDKQKFKELHNINSIYIPAGALRRSWRHPSALFGMSEAAVLVSNIVEFSCRVITEPENVLHKTMLFRALGTYFSRTATIVGTKRGEISNNAMSVRYPFSAKAVATMSSSLPANTVQIHSKMAKILKVSEGDYVLCERFPCLGFMGVRIQRVTITDDPMCRFTIRVSGNSLVSQNLDFDGDVIYLASFHTFEAKALLESEWLNPNDDCWKYVHKLNTRKGEPTIKCMGLQDYCIKPFAVMSADEKAKIVGKLTGVKAQTGPVIALAYNLMRIMETSGKELPKKTKAAVEMFIEKAGQSVFEQKHGGQSLHDIVIEAICTGSVTTLVEEGFNPETSKLICDTIRERAAGIGVHDLAGFHKTKGQFGSNIVNRIVRKEHKLYFASRSDLDGYQLMEHLTEPAVDLPSRLYALTTSARFENNRNGLDCVFEDKILENIESDPTKLACKALFKCIDALAGVKRKPLTVERKHLWHLTLTNACSVEL